MARKKVTSTSEQLVEKEIEKEELEKKIEKFKSDLKIVEGEIESLKIQLRNENLEDIGKEFESQDISLDALLMKMKEDPSLISMLKSKLNIKEAVSVPVSNNTSANTSVPVNNEPNSKNYSSESNTANN